MAAVTRPGPADARVPCPLCGGLIHPIAGRCKHCKGDLRAMRTARPAAAATLPALGAPGAPNPAPANASAPLTNGHAPAPPHGATPTAGYAPAPPPQSLVQAVAAAAPIPLAIQGGGAESIPILPPRPTGRFAAPAPRASWRSWPVIVIILAVIAIVTAVVLMLFPPGGARDEGTRNSVQPAPERMDTNPSPSTPHPPPSTGPDPWSRRGSAGGSAGSAAPPAADDDRDIDDPSVDDALANRDPLSRRGGGGSLQPGIGALNTDMLFSIFRHGCARVSACGSASAEVEMFCTNLGKVAPTQPPTCAAAPRCLRTIDQMSCDTFTDVQSIYALKDKLSDCVDAMGC